MKDYTSSYSNCWFMLQLPELSARVKEFIENGLDTADVTILLQNAGLLVGFLIMYSLVSYGEVIEEVFR